MLHMARSSCLESPSFRPLKGITDHYFQPLCILRRRAVPKEEVDLNSGQPDRTELERYARHIVLRQIGGAGQQRLKKARVLMVGAGGLGSPVLQYLAAAGAGTIGVIDNDKVSVSNLQRQVLFKDDQIGMPKVFAAEAGLKAQNPFVIVRPYNRQVTGDIAVELFRDYDLILDGTDNFTTRSLINRAAVMARRPLIFGAISQWEGQVSLFDPAAGTPCYACVFPTPPGNGPGCADAGVMGALPGIIGSMMAAEAIKRITGAGHPLAGRMLIFDALYGESRIVEIERCPDCTVCGGN
ncbi:MAG: HesA/MoeB/ThiF family protein [Rhodobacteraceae bacterium]|nr:HesA/MoeB/ThiF family protein [Paracoccaceae bacterium]